MTDGNGHNPPSGGRRGVRGKAPDRPPFVETGWEDFDPETDEAEGGKKKGKPRRGEVEGRDYRASRAGGLGSVIRFTVFTGLIAGIVLGGLYFFARPAVFHAIADWGAENPTALKLPFVPDIVRGELGEKLTKPVDATDFREVVFQIKFGQTTVQIGDSLQQAGLVTDSRAFVFEAIEKNATSYFIAGRHVLSRAMTIDQIIQALTAPQVAPPTVRLVFREGLRLEQMVAKLEYLESHPADPGVVLKLDIGEYYQIVTHPPVTLLAQYKWLQVPAGATLEGFLFPATYDVDPSISALALVELQLDAFAANAPPALLARPPDEIYRTVQVASLVELEATLDTDRPLVAGVYINRLDKKKWPTGLLEADPAVYYANDSVWLQSHPISTWVDYTFWVPYSGGTPLAKLQFPDNIAPYNTYHHAGLMPTPICSPGLVSLQAAFEPDTKDGYYFFLAKNDGSGSLAFAKTNAEQIANEKKYGYIK
jgi:UPF0755 protein